MDERKKIIIKSAKETINELQELIFNNIWINYFLQNDTYLKENWIDFEFEISKVIQSLDNDWHSFFLRTFYGKTEVSEKGQETNGEGGKRL